jgi:2-haloacid dehalogenase
MLERALRSAGIYELLDGCFSVENVGVFKPDPAVYAIPLKALGVAVPDATFQSSSAWDAAGAAAFGLKVFWINRARLPAEYEHGGRVTGIENLSRLPRARGQAAA